MRTYELGEVIALQEFEALREDGTVSAITVRLGKPFPDPESDHGEWVCPYQVTGIGKGRVKATIGLDGVHALSLALHIFPVELVAVAEEEGATLRYLGQSPVFFGGPCRTLLQNS